MLGHPVAGAHLLPSFSVRVLVERLYFKQGLCLNRSIYYYYQAFFFVWGLLMFGFHRLWQDVCCQNLVLLCTSHSPILLIMEYLLSIFFGANLIFFFRLPPMGIQPVDWFCLSATRTRTSQFYLYIFNFGDDWRLCVHSLYGSSLYLGHGGCDSNILWKQSFLTYLED